ncbi:MAG: cupredoxin domain-containing protein [Acidimicrobiia bacterium]|jgi:cytochrome c oxidase subunit 2
MRRSLIAVVLSLLTLSLVLAACGDDDASTDTPMGSMPGQRADDMGGMDGHDESTPVAPGARRIEVEATSFEFDPDEITVTAGEDIAIVLSSDDLLHDFTIDDIDVHVAADRGETAEGGLRAEEPGEYTFYCTVAGHREAGMEGTLVVEEP